MIDGLRTAGIEAEYNYVTAPSPIRSHAASYAEPAPVAMIRRPRLAKLRRPLRVAVLDTGRPRYTKTFRTKHAARLLGSHDEPGSSPEDHIAPRRSGRSPDARSTPAPVVDNLEPWAAMYIDPSALPLQRSNAPVYDDEDTMITSSGLLRHPHGGHGLFVASIVSRYAPGVQIVPEATTSFDEIGDLNDMLVDIEHALSVNCRILNMSMGFQTDPDRSVQTADGCPSFLERALLGIQERGAKLVASAGNDGSNRPMWPAAHETVIAVGATDERGNPMDWSNYGDWVDAWTCGEDIVSDYPVCKWLFRDRSAKVFRGAADWNGTSFSAPLIAALLARRLDRSAPGDDASDAWTALVASGRPLADHQGVYFPVPGTRGPGPSASRGAPQAV